MTIDKRSEAELLKQIQKLETLNSNLTEQTEKLTKENIYFHSFFDESPVGSVIMGKDKKFIRCNSSFCNFMGYTENELIGKTLSEVTHPEDIELGMNELQQILDGNFKSAVVQKRYIRKDGTIAWGEVSISLVRDTHNKPLHFLPIIQDITSRKKSEDALKISNDRLVSLADYLPAFIAYVNADTLIYEFVNRAYQESFGIPVEKIIGSHISKVIGEENYRFALKYIEIVRSGKSTSYENIFDMPSGKRWNSVNYAPRLDENGKVTSIVVLTYDITDHKKDKQALKESEEKYKALFEANTDGITIFSINQDGPPSTILDTNENSAKMLGYSKEEFLVLAPVIMEKDLTPEKTEIRKQELLRNGITNFETVLRHKDGHEVYVEIKVLLINYFNQPAFMNIVRDITDRKLIEEMLHKNEARLRKTQEIAHLGSWELDIDTKKLIWSEEVYKIFGLHPHEFNETLEAFYDLITKEDRDIINSAYYKSIDANSAGYMIEHNIIRKHTGEIRYVFEKCEHIRDEHGKIVRSLGMVQDITERKQIEQTLKDSEEQLQLIINGTLDYFFRLKINSDGSTFMEFVSDNYSAITGKNLSEVQTVSSWRSIIHPDDIENLYESIGKIIKTKQRERLECRSLVLKNVRYLEINAIPVINGKNGTVTHILGTVKDITQQKLAEMTLKENEAKLRKLNEEKDKFFSIIAHDLRSPFNVFLGFTEMMAEELDSMPIKDLQKITMSMKTSANNLFQLLENLLEWSRFQRGMISFKPELTLLRPRISDSLQPIIIPVENKGIGIKIEVPDDFRVFADSNMLISILSNLTYNAFKFTPHGGTITISAIKNADKETEITVKDTGIGMTQDILSNLFMLNESATRAGTEGEPSTGLGLIICKDFVEKHCGIIKVESEVDKGSTFTFTLPDHGN